LCRILTNNKIQTMKKLIVLVSVVALFAAVSCKPSVNKAEQARLDSLKQDSIMKAADTTKKVDTTMKAVDSTKTTEVKTTKTEVKKAKK
jgi:hypothetical protein